jgi:hypothetical protein
MQYLRNASNETIRTELIITIRNNKEFRSELHIIRMQYEHN